MQPSAEKDWSWVVNYNNPIQHDLHVWDYYFYLTTGNLPENNKNDDYTDPPEFCSIEEFNEKLKLGKNYDLFKNR